LKNKELKIKPVANQKNVVGTIIYDALVILTNWLIYTIIALFNLTKAIVLTAIGIVIRPFDRIALVSSAIIDISPKGRKAIMKGDEEDE
jgi:hypothetical protein